MILLSVVHKEDWTLGNEGIRLELVVKKRLFSTWRT
jgi:hypothetical protein